MKKTFAILFFVSFSIVAFAQTFQRGDTLVFGERWPTYYYWGDNWIDRQYDPAYPGGFGCPFMGASMCKPEYARYIYTDSSLRVIGIAVAYTYIDGYWSNGDQYADFQIDYFRLYEVDSTTNEMILIAEKPLIDTSVACYLPQDIHGPILGVRPAGLPVREVYFDSAITVYDSFYVAATNNNNFIRHSYNDNYVHTGISTIRQINDYYKPTCYPEPNHYRRKLHLLNNRNYDFLYHITDTNWHILHTTFVEDSMDLDKPEKWYRFIMMFPIIDTTPDNSWVPECKRPVGLGTIHVGKEVVVLGWESEGSSQWELKVAKEGEDLDSVTPIACTSDVVPVYGLDTASRYVSTVRSICGENRISEWSDIISFFVPGDTTSTDPTEGIGSMVEQYTHLMPNPATEQVTVVSSFRIDRVEVYTLTGQRIVQEKVGGISTEIDVSSLPKATYLVRIHTNRGLSTKRLIVR